MKKAVTAILLSMLMVLTPMTAFAIQPYGDDAEFIPLRETFYTFGVTVEWDEENRAAIIDNTFIVVIEDVGGFIEDGVSFVPIQVITDFMIYIGVIEEPVERIDLTIWNAENFIEVREPAFTSTDIPHGEISVHYIQYMSDNIGARSAFTYRELEAAVWIVEELLAMGHDWDNIEVQEFTYWEIVEAEIGLFPLNWAVVTSPMILGVDREYQLRADRVSQNVVLTIPGQSQRTIVIGAHYDSPPYPSASDNASSTALLLESAQRMLELDHYYTLVYVFFGAEEVGLIGAYHYVYSLTQAESDNIVMMINADVIIEGPYVFFGAGTLPTLTDEELAELAEIFFYENIEMFTAQFYLTLESIERHIEALLMEFPDETFEISDFFIFETVEEFLVAVKEGIFSMPSHMMIFNATMMGIMDFPSNAVIERVQTMAAELSEAHDFELLDYPELAAFPTDSLAFLFNGFTVVNLVGMERTENVSPELAAQLTRLGEGTGDGAFTVTILHTPLDEFSMIEYLWPGMMDANMYAFNIFLEAMLTARYTE
ncbi:MAG: M28 family peptidase [Defluviitaleaceae bacterium]|nr:M28 family peptidase [Defluviitaleaceae bacterium]